MSARSQRRVIAAASSLLAPVATAAALALPAGVAAAVVLPSGQAGAAGDPGSNVPVIIRYGDGGPAPAERAVAGAGGTVGQSLGVASAISASVPSNRLAQLASAPGVVAVTPDAPVRLRSALVPDPAETPMYAVNQYIGAPDVWAKADSSGKKITGKGVGVALIDSGISPVKGLANPARLINGPDLSLDSQQASLRNLDSFGHGTHLAGIIAGRDPEVAAGAENDPNRFVGVAPDANLLNVKVAATDGSVDVSQVLAAIDWVVTHRNDIGVNIKVLNLSFGTDSVQDARYDPLSFAVENAWRKGIVVVVAAGNDGVGAGLGMPAMNPYVIAVGAADHKGTDATGDDVVAGFSSRGNDRRRPDLVAPGRSVVSLRDVGSFIDDQYPSGRVTSGLTSVAPDSTGRYFRGSGTSQAAAVVSGAAALLLQQRPSLTPDQVKRLLTSTATPMPSAEVGGKGAGQLNIKAAIAAGTPWGATQFHPPAVGTGSLEQSRGGAHVMDFDTGAELTGERDIMGRTFNSATWAGKVAAGNPWSGGAWNSTTWAGGGWLGAATGVAKTWSPGAWSTSWSGSSWTSMACFTGTWDGRTWSGRTWSGRTWSGRTWSGRTWSGRTWSGRTWSSDWDSAWE